jgi:EAL domain-containing protein (putative c-di-GMP-specific phosphodiesterase class I)/ActR/RegA family two-component response regulator
MTDQSCIRLLILDDDPSALRLLGLMLQNLGFASVASFNSGRAALEQMGQGENSPDVILLDLNMPEMDGIEFVRKLVERNFTGSLVLVSGEDERVLQSVESLVRAHRIAILGSLQKPVTPGRLTELLGRWSPPTRGAPRSAKKIYSAAELRAAIANGELVNFYQPQVAVATGELVGVESLVRWRHPQDGMVFPDQYIGIAETHGLIDDLTRVVLDGALAQSKRWDDAGLTLKVAINVSMDNLASLDFADFVAAQTAKAGVSPHSVVLEVTESRLMLDARAPLEILTRLRMKRFHLSIDDFGTGNSSMTQLRDIPFSELKIDQSFVHGAWANDTLKALFDSSLSLAKQLGMDTVAEGVEDRADWDFLRKTECQLAQGYFIAKPMPASELPGWMVGWQERVSGFAK